MSYINKANRAFRRTSPGLFVSEILDPASGLTRVRFSLHVEFSSVVLVVRTDVYVACIGAVISQENLRRLQSTFFLAHLPATRSFLSRLVRFLSASHSPVKESVAT